MATKALSLLLPMPVKTFWLLFTTHAWDRKNPVAYTLPSAATTHWLIEPLGVLTRACHS